MRNSILLFILLGLLFFSGCIQQNLYQKIEPEGNSTLRLDTDFSGAIELSQKYGEAYGLPGGLDASMLAIRLGERCLELEAQKPGLRCTVRENTMSVEISIPAKNKYYEWKMQEGIPFRTYRLVVTQIPLDQFIPPDLPGSGDLPVVAAIDLEDKDANILLLEDMPSNSTFAYAIEMPGEIVRAEAGSYPAVVSEQNRRIATFNLLAVLANSEPLVVEAQELNITLVIALVAIALVVVLSFSLSKGRHTKF